MAAVLTAPSVVPSLATSAVVSAATWSELSAATAAVVRLAAVAVVSAATWSVVRPAMAAVPIARIWAVPSLANGGAERPHLRAERRHGGSGEADDVGGGERRHLVRGKRLGLGRALSAATWAEVKRGSWSVVRPAMAAVLIALIWAVPSLASAAVLSTAT